MADVKQVEEIGLALQERKKAQDAEKLKELPPSLRAQTFEDAPRWDNSGFRSRVAEILSSAQYMVVNLDMIVMPEKGFAKFQYRRTRKNFEIVLSSIKERGVLEDITLQRVINEDGVTWFFVVDGHTRLLALKKALKEDANIPIPIFRVLDVKDADAAQVALELNRFSENFDEEDKQALVMRLYEEAGLTQKDIAEQLDWSPSYISTILSAFRDVPVEARDFIETRKWTVTHGRELARLKDDTDEQQRIFDLAKKHRYASAKLKEMVDKSKARDKYKKLAKGHLKEALPEDKKTITTGQLEKIHAKTLNAVSDSYRYGKKTISVGSSHVEPVVSHTREVVESLGYEVVEGKAKADDPEKTERPKMPNERELMEGSYYKTICLHCKGRTHAFVAEELNFDTEPDYGSGSIAHKYCALKADIAELQKKLAADSITKMLEKDPDLTLEKLSNQSHALYKTELERRKQAWRDEHLPKPEKTVKKGTKVGEPVSEKPKDPIAVLQKVRKKQPKLVAQKYWDPYERYLKKEEGYQTHRQVIESTLGLSKGSIYRAFKKLEKAIEEEIA